MSYALTSGNEIGLCTADYIRYLVDDPDIKVIGCFIEAIRQADEFKSACEYARDAGKPIVAVKIGGSEESRKAALAHTGSLAGALACFDAVAETLGVVRVDTLDEMVETIDYFAHAAPPRGPRLGALTFSGGLKGLMLEFATRNGLAFPALQPKTTAALREVLGVGTSLGNPLDGGFTALSSPRATSASSTSCCPIPASMRCRCKKSCRRPPAPMPRPRTCARSMRWRQAAASRSPWCR